MLERLRVGSDCVVVRSLRSVPSIGLLEARLEFRETILAIGCGGFERVTALRLGSELVADGFKFVRDLLRGGSLAFAVARRSDEHVNLDLELCEAPISVGNGFPQSRDLDVRRVRVVAGFIVCARVVEATGGRFLEFERKRLGVGLPQLIALLGETLIERGWVTAVELASALRVQLATDADSESCFHVREHVADEVRTLHVAPTFIAATDHVFDNVLVDHEPECLEIVRGSGLVEEVVLRIAATRTAARGCGSAQHLRPSLRPDGDIRGVVVETARRHETAGGVKQRSAYASGDRPLSRKPSLRRRQGRRRPVPLPRISESSDRRSETSPLESEAEALERRRLLLSAHDRSLHERAAELDWREAELDERQVALELRGVEQAIALAIELETMAERAEELNALAERLTARKRRSPAT